MMMLIALGIVTYLVIAAVTFIACFDDGLLVAFLTAVLWPGILIMAIVSDLLRLLVVFLAVIIRH